MKNYVRIVIVVCIIFVIGLLGCLTIMDRHLHNISENDVDVIQLNDIRETVKQNWDALQNLDSEEFEVDFVVLDNINNILYSSDSIEENEKLTVEEAIKNRYPYSYVVRDNKIVGCVVMLDSGEEIYMSIRNISAIARYVESCFLLRIITKLLSALTSVRRSSRR